MQCTTTKSLHQRRRPCRLLRRLHLLYIYIYIHRNVRCKPFPLLAFKLFFLSRYIDLSTSKALGEFVETAHVVPCLRVTWPIRI